jgi:DNA helicase-2/ATP-dependent DNA helicase PcrA
MIKNNPNDKIIKQILENRYPLSETQQNVIKSTSSHIRNIAGPGAGKSEVMIRKVVYYLQVEDAVPEEIVLISFNEKAASNLRSKLYRWASNYGDEELKKKISRLNVQTIDSYVKKLLEELWGYGNFDIINREKEMALLLRHGMHLGIHKLPPHPGKVKNSKYRYFLDTLDLVENEMIDNQYLNVNFPVFQNAMHNYSKFLKTHRLLPFRLATHLAIENLENTSTPKPKISHVLVDEYHDNNHAQEKLIQLLAKKAKLVVVCDPMQTIYQWRGSDPKCIENFVTMYPKAETVKMEDNYRSREDIVEFINGMKKSSQWTQTNSLKLNLVATRKGNNNIYSNNFSTPKKEATWIADCIEKYVQDGGKYKDCAALYRSVKSHASPLIGELKKRNIPSAVTGKIGLFAREEVQSVGKILAWVSSRGFFKEDGPTASIRGDNLLAEGLDDWITTFPESNLPPNIRSLLEEWKTHILSGKYNSFKQVYESLLNILNFQKLDESNPEQKLMIVNLGKFATLLSDLEFGILVGGRKRNWNSDMNTLCFFLNEAKYIYADGSAEFEDVDAVNISTIHQSKGLDWPVVFLPALIDGHFPSSQTGKMPKYMIDVSSFEIDRYAGTMSEEFNLFYVAISRAKNTLVLSRHQTKDMMKETEISPFLENSLQSDLVIKLNGSDKFPDFQINNASADASEEIKSYSLSDIVLYSKCPRLYWLREKCGFSSEFSPMLGYGKSMHFCLRNITEKTGYGKDVADIIDDVVEDDFYLPFAPYRKSAKEKAKQMLHNYISKNPEDLQNITRTEVPITLDMNDYLIVGKADAIIGQQVRDYKTSDQVMSLEDMKLQIGAYALGLQKEGYDLDEGSVAYLESGNVEAIDIDDDAMTHTQKQMNICVKGMQTESYSATTSSFCSDCDMKIICKFASNKSTK